ncbi:MAG: diversity-generating retroelement protein Avd [Candidatus Jacksonbacteria bacterium]|nr:diversity-generating retroelement protein Avd [Candidatus Paceibacterota bacterium]MBT3512303.1 diversity-generating retroelement protein Avd [Candidatus Paceibacterota bacterium]MBT7338354.1 diversity-generating retroelement protein Avd [Candidatus Jacksonbacteria bacterium]
MEKFILHQKTYDFVLWLYPIINRLPKNHRQILGKKLEEEGLSLLVSLINANNARGIERDSFQKLSSNELDLLRILLRLTKDLRLMSVKQYLLGSEKLNEIGRMLNCWMRKGK